MNRDLLFAFIGLNIVNVIIQTVKSIATVKCGKTAAAFINAIAYGLYTVVVVYTVCDLPLWLKVVVVGLCNLVGVYLVKWAKKSRRKTSCGKLKQRSAKPHLKNTKMFLHRSKCRTITLTLASG